MYLENYTFSFTCNVHRFRLLISVVAYYCACIRSSLNYAYAISSCTCTCTYPVVNDLWGATDVATLSLNFILFSASLTASQNFNLVYLAISPNAYLCRPLLLPPCTVPCKIVLASSDDLDTCPNHFNLRFFTEVKISS